MFTQEPLTKAAIELKKLTNVPWEMRHINQKKSSLERLYWNGWALGNRMSPTRVKAPGEIGALRSKVHNGLTSERASKARAELVNLEGGCFDKVTRKRCTRKQKLYVYVQETVVELKAKLPKDLHETHYAPISLQYEARPGWAKEIGKGPPW